MSRLRSLITLVWILVDALARPLDDEDDEEDDGCGSIPTIPYRRPALPSYATVSQPNETPVIMGTVVGIVVALVAFSITARYIVRRRPIVPRFVAFRSRSKKRLSDESWVSPALPSLGSPVSPLSQDLRDYALPQRKLVPVTTPVCTPTDTEFGTRTDAIQVPPVRVPSPVYFSPFSPSPSLSSSSSLSPAPSTPDMARLSRLLSSTFRDSRASPARPSTALLIDTARAYAHAYRPSSATTTSLYTQPTPSARLSGARCRNSFYPDLRGWGRVRDTLSTVSTLDTVPHLLHAVTEAPMIIEVPVGTALGEKVRLSDASEHARYRQREREREETQETTV